MMEPPTPLETPQSWLIKKLYNKLTGARGEAGVPESVRVYGGGGVKRQEEESKIMGGGGQTFYGIPNCTTRSSLASTRICESALKA